MDFCLTRIYSKFYITQILHSMKYIEFNHINYCLQEELDDINNHIDQVSYSPNKDNNENKTNMAVENFAITGKDEKNSNQEEQKIVLEELEKENHKLNINIKESSNLIIKSNPDKEQCENNLAHEKISNLKTEEINYINEQKDYNEKETLLINKKKYELIELNKENEAKYRKTVVYKNNIFSKVEIQGMVVDKKSFGHSDQYNYRTKLIIDDTTGVIEVFVWRSKKENIFNKIRDEVVCLI